MATHEASIPSDPTQERFADLGFFDLSALAFAAILSIAVDRALLIVDHHLEKAKKGTRP
jgi:hypothetical protein